MRILVLAFLAGCDRTPEADINPNPASVAEPTAKTEVHYDHKVFGPPCDPFAALPEDQKVWRAIGIDYPKGPGHVLTYANFDDIVDFEVVKNTMAVYACTNHMNDQRDPLASVMGIGRRHDLSIEGLSYFARTMAYTHIGLDSLAETNGPAYFAAGDKVRGVVREYLKDPAHLKEVYHGYKPALLEGVNKAQAPEPIRTYLNEVVIPYFAQPVPENVLEAERMLLAAEAKCEGLEWEKGGEQCYDTERAAREALIGVTPDYRVLQWMHRRRAEGGDELVRAWGEILTDFSRSL